MSLFFQHQINSVTRIDYCMAGFRALIVRLLPSLPLLAMTRLEKKLSAGTPLTPAEIDDVFRELSDVEDRLIHFTRADLASAARTEQIAIEFEAAGIIHPEQEAA